MMGQKIKLQTFVHIFKNTDGFYQFYISLEIRSMERGICPIAVLFCIKTRFL